MNIFYQFVPKSFGDSIKRFHVIFYGVTPGCKHMATRIQWLTINPDYEEGIRNAYKYRTIARDAGDCIDTRLKINVPTPMMGKLVSYKALKEAMEKIAGKDKITFADGDEGYTGYLYAFFGKIPGTWVINKRHYTGCSIDLLCAERGSINDRHEDDLRKSSGNDFEQRIPDSLKVDR